MTDIIADAISEISSGPDGLSDKPQLPRDTVTFEMPYVLCEPVLRKREKNFDVVLQSLNAAEELKAGKRAESPHELGTGLAKASLHKVDDTFVTELNRDVIWDMLGMKGRAAVLQIYAQHIGASADSEAMEETVKNVRVG
jgi:hypothetical protein